MGWKVGRFEGWSVGREVGNGIGGTEGSIVGDGVGTHDSNGKVSSLAHFQVSGWFLRGWTTQREDVLLSNISVSKKHGEHGTIVELHLSEVLSKE